MSQFVKCGSTIRDEECLIKALLRMPPRRVKWTKDHIEVHKEPTHLFGYQGDRRADLANIIIRRQHVGGLSNDIGFLKQPDGTYSVIISEYDKGYYTDAWVTELINYYNEERIIRECQSLGYSFQVEEKNGARQLVAYVNG